MEPSRIWPTLVVSKHCGNAELLAIAVDLRIVYHPPVGGYGPWIEIELNQWREPVKVRCNGKVEVYGLHDPLDKPPP